MKTRTNFENLRVYQLSEELSDNIWSIVIRWESFARETVGKQLTRAVDSIGANIARAKVEQAIRTIVASLRSPGDRYRKHSIGYARRFGENS